MENFLVVIGFSGIGGGKVKGDTLWTITTAYSAWKLPNNKLIIEKGRIFLKGDDGLLKNLRKKIKPNSVIEITGKKNENRIEIIKLITTTVALDEEMRNFITEQE